MMEIFMAVFFWLDISEYHVTGILFIDPKHATEKMFVHKYHFANLLYHWSWLLKAKLNV